MINVLYPALFMVGMLMAGPRPQIEDRTQDQVQTFLDFGAQLNAPRIEHAFQMLPEMRVLTRLPPSTPMARALGEGQLQPRE
jgi:hypothetical protein